MEERNYRRLNTPERVEIAIRMTQRARTRETVVYIASFYGISRNHCYDLEKLYQQDPNMGQQERPGRPLKVDANMERRIIREIKKNPFATSTQLTRIVNIGLPQERQIAPSTLRTYAIKNGLISRRPAIKAPLKPKHIKERREFVKLYLKKDMRFWSRVLFSDETKILLNPVDHRQRVRRPKHRRHETKYVVQKPKFGGGGMMFWGSINLHGTGTLISVEEKIYADTYTEIIEQGIEEAKEKLNMRAFRLQDDNAPSHRAIFVDQYKEREGIQSLPNWPSNSPDLNPIEGIWLYLKDKIRARGPKTLEKLEEVAFEEWNLIPVEEVAKRIRSMPARLAAVKRARGLHTRF